MNFADKVMLFFSGAICGIIVLAIATALAGKSPAQMQEKVRCAVIWERSHTTADTLAAIRQGCLDPTPVRP